MNSKAIGVLAIAFACPPAAWATKRTDRSTAIEIYHRADPAGRIVDTSTGEESSVDAVNTFSMRKNERVLIILKDPDPLLFVYEAKTTLKDTDQYKLAIEFAKQLDELVKPFKTTKGGGGNDEALGVRVIEGLNVEAFRGLLASLTLDVAPPQVLRVLRESWGGDVQTLKIKANGWKEQNGKLIEALAIVPRIAQKCLIDRQVEADGKVISCGCELYRQYPSPDRSKKNCDDSLAVRPDLQTPGHTQTIESFITLAAALQPKIEATVAFRQTLAEDIEGIDKAVILETRPYSIQEQSVEVSVKPTSRYDDFMDATLKAKRQAALRQFKVVINPHTPVVISVAPAFVLGFIRNPTFAAVKQGGDFVITQAGEDATGYDVAAMLNLQPARWSEPTFGGFFQVGVSPKKGASALYFGAGIQVQTVFGLGGGFLWQQVNELAGQEVGQHLTSPDLLKTRARFKPGFYLNISVKLP